jgi:hypothetical protein
MKVHSTNYRNTFIEVAADCPATSGAPPPEKGSAASIATIQFDLIKNNPYKFTSDEVLFQVYTLRNEVTESEYEAARARFFSKGQPCLRASPLTKRYGWGVHLDTDGKVALYGCETEEYKAFLQDRSLKVVRAMRSAKQAAKEEHTEIEPVTVFSACD